MNGSPTPPPAAAKVGRGFLGFVVPGQFYIVGAVAAVYAVLYATVLDRPAFAAASGALAVFMLVGGVVKSVRRTRASV